MTVVKSCMIWVTLMAALFSLPASAQGYDRYYGDLPVSVAMPELPRIAEREVNLADYGAAGDGVTLCTAAFSAAIDALDAGGGGRGADAPDG